MAQIYHLLHRAVVMVIDRVLSCLILRLALCRPLAQRHIPFLLFFYFQNKPYFQLHLRFRDPFLMPFVQHVPLQMLLSDVVLRSEERRVGKECGARWWAYMSIETRD